MCDQFRGSVPAATMPATATTMASASATAMPATAATAMVAAPTTAMPATMVATAVCRFTTGGSTGTITMHIASPVIIATAIAPPATDITSVSIITVTAHETDASRQGGQHRNGQPELDPVG
jgi:hypothetical protein